MIVSIIVAVAENGVIGKDNDLVWHLPDDMKFFKKTTTDHHILTGRKNYLSIPPKFRPLKNRTNMLLTRNENFKAPGCLLFNDLSAAIDNAKQTDEDELFIIGGGSVFNQALEQNLVDKLYVTEVHQSFKGDVFFPEIDLKKWEKKSERFHDKDEKHAYSFSFCIYEK